MPRRDAISPAARDHSKSRWQLLLIGCGSWRLASVLVTTVSYSCSLKLLITATSSPRAVMPSRQSQMLFRQPLFYLFHIGWNKFVDYTVPLITIGGWYNIPGYILPAMLEADDPSHNDPKFFSVLIFCPADTLLCLSLKTHLLSTLYILINVTQSLPGDFELRPIQWWLQLTHWRPAEACCMLQMLWCSDMVVLAD